MGMAMSWYPCAPCARAIVAAGIVEMLAIEPDWTSAKWGPSWLAAEEILAKAGVKVHFIQKQAA
jgi:deoxycytidylate deaminase